MTSSVIRHAVRRLVRAPVFALSAMLTLALGIAGTTAVFTVVNGVLFRPLPYHDPEQLVDLSHTLAIGGGMHVDQSDATFLYYRRANHLFADVGAYRTTAMNLRGDRAAPERIDAALTTPSVFRVLGAVPMRGRGLTERDGDVDAAKVVVLSEGLWSRTFGGDPSIIGRRVAIDGVEREVVGVMPASFHFPSAQSAMWLPLQLDPARTKSAAFDYRGIARMRGGVTLAAATAELGRLLPRVPEAFPGRLTSDGITATHMEPVVRPLRDVIVGDVGRVLWVVLGGVAALLLIACSNVANLFLARAEGRQRELAVRRALGAGRGALLMDFASEAVVLSLAGGALGLALATLGVAMLQANGPAASIPRFADVHVDGVVIAVAALVTALAAVIVSLLPALRSSRGSVSLSAALMATGTATLGGRTRHRARRALVVSQIALALVLVTGAGLFARSFASLRRVDAGFDAAHALAFRLALPEVTYPSAGDAARVVASTLNALAEIPGVQAAGVVTQLPLDEEAKQDSAVFVEDHPLQPKVMPNIHAMEFATPGYFTAMGVPLVAGRLFDALDPSRDPSRTPREVVVSEAFAKRYWSGAAQAVGRRVRMNGNPDEPWSTIVGVVGDVRYAGLDQPATETVYMPLVTDNIAGVPWAPRDLAFVAKTSADPASLTSAVRGAVQSVAPTLPVYHVTPLAELRAHAVARTTFTLLLLGVAAVVALAIGAMGIYGVIAYLVSLRTREIGVRLALGAQQSDVRRLVVGHAMLDAVIGVVLGLGAAIAATRAAAAALFGVSATDPWTMGAAAAVLLATAMAASWVPARRAAGVDPATALRTE